MRDRPSFRFRMTFPSDVTVRILLRTLLLSNVSPITPRLSSHPPNVPNHYLCAHATVSHLENVTFHPRLRRFIQNRDIDFSVLKFKNFSASLHFRFLCFRSQSKESDYSSSGHWNWTTPVTVSNK